MVDLCSPSNCEEAVGSGLGKVCEVYGGRVLRKLGNELLELRPDGNLMCSEICGHWESKRQNRFLFIPPMASHRQSPKSNRKMGDSTFRDLAGSQVAECFFRGVPTLVMVLLRNGFSDQNPERKNV